MDRRSLLQSGPAMLGLAVANPLRSGVAHAVDRPRTGYVVDARFDLPVFGSRHPEQPRRVQAINAAVRAAGLAARIAELNPPADVEAEIALVHTPAHIAAIRAGYDADINAVSRAAVAAGIAAVDAVARRTVRNAFVATRPPGHHARNTGREEGFCFFNNIAIAARHVQRRLGFERVLIVDWDYHHGNGTEELFYDDPSVFYFSTHDANAYPQTGDPERTGAGAGAGYTLNAPMPCGAGDADVLAIYRDRLLPAAQRFAPDFVLVSAGFDSRADDLLGCFTISDSGYRQMTRIVAGIAARHCSGRLVSMLEGGYNVPGLASAALAHLRALIDG